MMKKLDFGVDDKDVQAFGLDTFGQPMKDLAAGAIGGFVGSVVFDMLAGPRIFVEDGADFCRIEIGVISDCVACESGNVLVWWRHATGTYARLGQPYYHRLIECRDCSAVFSTELNEPW